MSRSLPTLALLVVLLAPSARTQTVWVLGFPGPGVDFSNFQLAVDTAADGDILLVRGGTYGGPGFPGQAPITIDGKSLTIQEDVGPPAVLLSSGLLVRNLGPGQRVVVRGITISCDVELVVEDCAGVVWFEDVIVSGQCNPFESVTSTVIDHCDQVVFNRCNLIGGFPFVFAESTSNSVHATQSKVHLYDTLVTGGASNGPVPSAYGMRMDGGFLMASGSTISGGGTANEIPCGGPGLWLASGFPKVYLLDTTITGGEGGCGIDPVQVDAGFVQPIAEPARSFSLNSPVRAGVDDAQLTFHGEPGETIFFYLGLEPLAFFKLGLGGTFQIGLPTLASLVLGTVPPSGELVVNAPTSPLPSGLDGFVAFVQAGYSQGTGHLVLGGGSAQLWVDSSF